MMCTAGALQICWATQLPAASSPRQGLPMPITTTLPCTLRQSFSRKFIFVGWREARLSRGRSTKSLVDQFLDLTVAENRAVAAYVAMTDGTVIAFSNATLHHAFQSRNDRFCFEPKRKKILDNEPDHDGRPANVCNGGLRLEADLSE